MTMTDLDLVRLRALEQAATPGLWAWHKRFFTILADDESVIGSAAMTRDGVALAESRNALPHLLDLIESQRNELERLAMSLTQYREWHLCMDDNCPFCHPAVDAAMQLNPAKEPQA